MPAFRREADGITLFVRVTPRADADRIDGSERRDDGSDVLRLRVRAVPDKGAANAAVLALVAVAIGVPKSAVGLVSGDTARLKILRIAGDPDLLIKALEKLG